MSDHDLQEHFFRHESARIVAALTRVFGVHNLALAEDVAQDSFQRALEVWQVSGLPDNPSAWLMRTAKNRALDVIRRERTARKFAPEVTRLLESEWTAAAVVDESFAADAIRAEQLSMMFSCCQPRLSDEVQVALILNILCGFAAGEIANAFLTGRPAIEKRISRGKKVLAASARLFDLSDVDFAARLSAVRRALYVLFSEGYHGGSAESAVRGELCAEAIRLTELLRGYQPAALPETNALAALMYLHAARLPAKLNEAGDLNPWLEQDRALWDAEMISRGLTLFDRSAAGQQVSAYHIEAAIAVAHASASTPELTDWNTVIALYDRLMNVAPSPVVALNRAIAIAQRDGPESGLAELRVIADKDRLVKYPFYPAAMGELELRRADYAAAREHFQAALALARNAAERRFIEKRLQAVREQPTRRGT